MLTPFDDAPNLDLQGKMHSFSLVTGSFVTQALPLLSIYHSLSSTLTSETQASWSHLQMLKGAPASCCSVFVHIVSFPKMSALSSLSGRHISKGSV